MSYSRRRMGYYNKIPPVVNGFAKIFLRSHRIGTLMQADRQKLEQVTGLEPVISAWKANVLPLHYTCLVRAKRLELIRLAALEPKSSASANSATPALQETGDPSEIRTPDPLIKSQMLCQLS